MKFILPADIESLLQSPVFIRHKQNVEFAIRKKPTIINECFAGSVPAHMGLII